MIILEILAGAIGGIIGGMGMGGGTLLIPLLTIFLGISQKLAQAYNLISFLIMAIFVNAALALKSQEKSSRAVCL